MQPLSFFFDHIGDTISRGNTPVQVTNENYLKLYELQSPGYTFSGTLLKSQYEDTFNAIPRVHVAESVCVSCEG